MIKFQHEIGGQSSELLYDSSAPGRQGTAPTVTLESSHKFQFENYNKALGETFLPEQDCSILADLDLLAGGQHGA